MSKPPLKAVGTRWRFESSHWSSAALTGPCTIVDNAGEPYPYEIQLDTGRRWCALDRELLALTPTAEATR